METRAKIWKGLMLRPTESWPHWSGSTESKRCSGGLQTACPRTSSAASRPTTEQMSSPTRNPANEQPIRKSLDSTAEGGNPVFPPGRQNQAGKDNRPQRQENCSKETQQYGLR